ncbi:MAG TPA: hypothetical protein VEQ58_21440, partial [Polyangiaceae bacterium]|nr:hypothetical protein [Polyangiaceae bacterium]
MSPSTALGGALLAVALVAWATPASAKPPKRDPPLLFGGAVKKAPPKPPLDPRLPTGTELEASRARPPVAASLCSFTRPVCVHATSLAAAPLLSEALLAFERAYEREVLALRLPAPLGDRDRGGSDALDWYLSAAPSELSASQEALLAGHMDAAAVFCESGSARGALLE